METKKIDTNKNTLSAVVIVKDEEEKIPDCLESLSWTDEIVVIDNGSIAAEGTHQELMQSSPIYQEIYESQLGNGLRLEELVISVGGHA